MVKYLSTKKLIDDSESKNKNKWMGQLGNRHDQSIFSILLYRNVKKAIIKSRKEEDKYFKLNSIIK